MAIMNSPEISVAYSSEILNANHRFLVYSYQSLPHHAAAQCAPCTKAARIAIAMAYESETSQACAQDTCMGLHGTTMQSLTVGMGCMGSIQVHAKYLGARFSSLLALRGPCQVSIRVVRLLRRARN